SHRLSTSYGPTPARTPRSASRTRTPSTPPSDRGTLAANRFPRVPPPAAQAFPTRLSDCLFMGSANTLAPMEVGMHRPRNVGWARAAALLYGDWGTSKAYVLGLAFLAARFASFPIILAVCALTGL